ncbi:MAG TPA: ribonuclease III family protein [bacterium]|nr:ribonuclease III family protein [bacterium]
MSAKPIFLDKKYTVVGDAVLNAAATVSTVAVGRPKSIRVKNRVLSQAFKRLDIAKPPRHDSHVLAEMYEGLVGFAYLDLGISFESLTSNLLKQIKNGRREEEVYTEFLKTLFQEVKGRV